MFDPEKLEDVLKKSADKVQFIIVTLTNNSAGGQPVSMENLRIVRQIADKYGKIVVFDAARFAENAYSSSYVRRNTKMCRSGLSPWRCFPTRMS